MNGDGVNRRSIQWFPGHMARTLRQMRQDVRGVDAVLLLLDARIPHSSLNPELERIAAAKPRLYVLNKADLADPALTARWVRWFRAGGAGCVAISAKEKGGAAAVRRAVDEALAGLLARNAQKGITGGRVRVMVAGIPNVGKSTFINSFAGAARAAAADRPGVTRGKQWIAAGRYDLLDLPGVLWNKFDSLETASNLAFIGSIRDDILDLEELAAGLLAQMSAVYPDRLAARYKLTEAQLALPAWQLLEEIGRARGMLMRGGEVDTARAAAMLMDEFRACRWGRITLERPPEAAADAGPDAPDEAAQPAPGGEAPEPEPQTADTAPDAPADPAKEAEG